MIRNTWKLLVLAIFAPILILQGCTVDGDDDVIIVEDNEPPAAPRGVYSVTGDRQVFVEWYPNQESDLEGYIVYRSRREFDDYVEIANVSSQVSSYVDDDVENGITYYYAVSAYDFDGRESELSPEAVDDTPRPEGRNIRIEDYNVRPNRSGFGFLNPERGARHYRQNDVDIYFGVDTEVQVPYIYSDIEVDGRFEEWALMQDLGYTDSMDDVDVSPTMGFTTLFVEAIIGHTYAFLMPDGHYAKIRVTDVQIDWIGDDVQDAWITFDWAYQLQPDNPELAPKKN